MCVREFPQWSFGEGLCGIPSFRQSQALKGGWKKAGSHPRSLVGGEERAFQDWAQGKDSDCNLKGRNLADTA